MANLNGSGTSGLRVHVGDLGAWDEELGFGRRSWRSDGSVFGVEELGAPGFGLRIRVEELGVPATLALQDEDLDGWPPSIPCR